MTVDILYSNPSVTNIGATTFGVYSNYKLIVITNATTTAAPGNSVCLAKGTSAPAVRPSLILGLK